MVCNLIWCGTRVLLLNCAILVTFLSQIYYENQILKNFLYSSWVILFVYLLVINKARLRLTRFSTVFLFGYLLYCTITFVLGTLISERQIPNYIVVLLVPLFVTICSDLYKNILNDSDIHKLCKNYIILCVIFGFYLLIIAFRYYNTAGASASEYAIEQKNSAGQIIGIGILLTFYLFAKKTTGWKKSFACGILLFLLYILTKTQCRSAMVAVFLVALLCTIQYIITNKRATRKNVAAITLIILLCLIFFEQIANILTNAFLFEKYNGADLNAISSGRIELIKIALQNYQNNLLFGIGRYYVDCSYIDILVENGIVGFVIIEFIWAYRIILNFKNRNINNLMFGMTLFFIVESIFEGFPPYGPGGCCFLFWFLSELNLSKNV